MMSKTALLTVPTPLPPPPVDEEDAEELASGVSINDFILIENPNAPTIIKTADVVAGEVPFLAELKTSPASSTDGTMFVRRRADDEAFVLKRITPDCFTKSIAKLELALQEAMTLRQLSHVNLVQVHQVFQENGHLYFLIEHVIGSNLAEAVQQQSGILFDDDKIIGWLRQLVAGLGFLHKKYVLHGNIKPENVLLSTSQKTARFSDFGMTKVFEIVGLSFQDRPGYSKSQMYAAPETLQLRDVLEQLESGELPNPTDDVFSAGEKADVWSLGVVIYEAMALKLPFNSIRSIMTRPPDPLPHEFGRELSEIVMKMLAKFPWDRVDIAKVSQEPIFVIRRILKQTPTPLPEEKPLHPNKEEQEQENENNLNCSNELFGSMQTGLAEAIEKGDGGMVAEKCRQAASKSKLALRRLLEASELDNQRKDSPLHIAARLNKWEAVKALCEAGAKANAVNRDGDMPLHLAAIEGHHRCVRYLLEYSQAERDVKGDFGRTPLHMAVANNHEKVVELLMAYNANPNEPSGADEDAHATPLHFACMFGFAEIVRMLLKGGGDTSISDANGDQALHIACRSNKSAICDMLIADGADLEAPGFNSRTPLYYALTHNYVDVLEVLIKNGVDINSKNHQDKMSRTPLHLAVVRKSLKAVNALIDRHVAWLRPDARGNTPLHLAVALGYAAIVETFLDRGLNVDTPNTKTGWTPLHTAAAHGQRNCMYLLLKRGADIEATSGVSDDRRTPLHVAVLSGHLDTARLLLQHGANLMAQNGSNEVALITAAINNKPLMVYLLTENFNVNIDLRSEDGRTALHHACRLDKYYSAKALLERNANMELRNQKGETPFAEAVISGSAVCVELLWSWGANAETPDGSGWLPIHLAVINNRKELVVFLVNRARVNIEALGGGQRKLTPLQLACSENVDQAVDVLLKLGAQRDVKVAADDDVAQTPLQIAASQGNAKICYLLILAGVKVDLPNWRGETALMLAVKGGHAESARVLLRDGKTNVEMFGHLGRRVLHYAIEANSQACTRLVALDYNASVDIYDDNKETPFEMAARLGHVEIGAILLSKQGDLINHVNEAGETALHIAAKYGRVEFVQFLVDHGSDPSLLDERGSTPLQLAQENGADDDGKVADLLTLPTANNLHQLAVVDEEQPTLLMNNE